MLLPSIEWLRAHLGADVPADGDTVAAKVRVLRRTGVLLRDLASVDDAGQAQMKEIFAFKWHKPENLSFLGDG